MSKVFVQRTGAARAYGLSLGIIVAVSASWLGCAAAPKSEVVVMGMIHDGHRTSKRYGIDTIQRYVRAIQPDYILCEIPPDRYDAAISEFRKTGTVTEPRVRRFPEYVDAIFPLTREMDFVIVPCAAWTKAMSDDRNAKLKRWKTTRPDESREVDEAEEAGNKQIEALGWNDDPVGIHTGAYDVIVKGSLEPYNRLFNDDLGAGGWDNINAGHYALISAALDRYAGSGRRFLITFGAWHKYWILEQLRKRRDVVLRTPQDYLSDQAVVHNGA